VTADAVAGGRRAGDGHARAAVEGDDVARAGRRAADGIVASAALDADAVQAVAEGCAVAVQADPVALDHAGGGARPVQEDAVLLVAAADVAGRGGGAADGDRAAVGDLHARLVSQGCRARGVGADPVPLDPHVLESQQLYAGPDVARDQVAGPRVGAADDRE